MGIPFVFWSVQESLVTTMGKLVLLFIVLIKMNNPLVYATNFRANKKWLLLTIAMVLTALYGMNTYTEFLYFQF